MKKKILSALLLSLFCVQAFSQKISFESLDSTSSLLSGLQTETEGKIYREPSGDAYTLSFPERSFNVWFYNKLASHAVYKKRGDKEVLELTENIDFSKATAVLTGEDNGGVIAIRVKFPEGHLKTQLIENGKVVSTVRSGHLDFYCRYGAVNADKDFLFDVLFVRLYELACLLQIEKGLMTEERMNKEWLDFNNLSPTAFFDRYTGSLLSEQASANEDRKKIEEAARLKKTANFLESFAKRYAYRPGSTLTEFAAMDVKNKAIANKKEKRRSTDDRGNTYVYRENAGFISVETGPYELISMQDEVIVHLEYIVEKGSAAKKAATLNEIAAELKSNIEKKYIEERFVPGNPGQLSSITVTVPGTALVIKAAISNTLSLFFDYNPFEKRAAR